MYKSELKEHLEEQIKLIENRLDDFKDELFIGSRRESTDFWDHIKYHQGMRFALNAILSHLKDFKV